MFYLFYLLLPVLSVCYLFLAVLSVFSSVLSVYLFCGQLVVTQWSSATDWLRLFCIEWLKCSKDGWDGWMQISERTSAISTSLWC